MKHLGIASLTLVAVLLLAPTAQAGTTTTTAGICGPLFPSDFLDEGLPQAADSEADCVRICRTMGATCHFLAHANARCMRRGNNGSTAVSKLLCNNSEGGEKRDCKKAGQSIGADTRHAIGDAVSAADAACRDWTSNCVQNCRE